MKDGWKTRPLGDVCQVIGGGTPSKAKSEYYTGNIPWATVRDMGSEVISETECKITKEAVKSSATNIIPGDNVVIATRVGLGKVCLIEQDTAINQDLRGVIPHDPRTLSVRFLFLWLKSVAHLIVAEGTGATVQGVKLPFIKSLEVPLPPLPEQQRIIRLLDEAFEGIATAKANAGKNLQNARALFESHLQSIFAQRGEGWVEKRLGEICERVSVGHVGPTSEFYCDQADGIPFLRSQNVRRGRLSWDGIQYVTKEFHQRLRKSQLRVGDLLFVRVGANRGDCCSVPNDVGELNCANIVFSRPIEGNAAYLERYCESTHGRDQLLGMTTGSAQGVINTSSVAELVVPIPPLLEQKRIVDSLNELQAETQRLESLYQRKLAALEALKRSLLHQAFTGEL